MIEKEPFKAWLKENTSYSDAVIKDIVSRANRADGMLQWSAEETYLFFLERSTEFQSLTVNVRSQIRKAVKLYSDFHDAQNGITG